MISATFLWNLKLLFQITYSQKIKFNRIWAEPDEDLKVKVLSCFLSSCLMNYTFCFTWVCLFVSLLVNADLGTKAWKALWFFGSRIPIVLPQFIPTVALNSSQITPLKRKNSSTPNNSSLNHSQNPVRVNRSFSEQGGKDIKIFLFRKWHALFCLIDPRWHLIVSSLDICTSFCAYHSPPLASVCLKMNPTHLKDPENSLYCSKNALIYITIMII